ncbi:MAG: hypothetical protein ACM3PY_11490 [Omnitrophica WOR_2 bacterium]
MEAMMTTRFLNAFLRTTAIAFVVMLLIPSPVLAQTGPEPTTDIDHKALGTLWDMYRGRTNIQKRQDKLFNKARRLETKIQLRISKYQLRGYDTSYLEKALTQFQAQVALAIPLHEDAAGWFQSHPGFDDDGQVIDKPLARVTLKHILDDQVGVNKIMIPALYEFQQSIVLYKHKTTSH